MFTFMLFLAPGKAQEHVPGDVLSQEWTEIQVNTTPGRRKDWWRDIDSERLDDFLKAGVGVNVTDRRGWTPLHSAARYNSDPEVLNLLLKAGAAVDAKDRSRDTPLHWAAADNSNTEIIASLLGAGADVNARDKYGWLPIHAAAEGSSNPDVIVALIAAGAKTNKRAYFFLFSPEFLVKHNSNMSESSKEIALESLRGGD